jgi:putative SOS response-associated peptidase YedK
MLQRDPFSQRPHDDTQLVIPQRALRCPHSVYGFLTTAPNAVVEPIHLKAMPIFRACFRRAAVIRNAGTDRELTMMRWGMPPPLLGTRVHCCR